MIKIIVCDIIYSTARTKIMYQNIFDGGDSLKKAPRGTYFCQDSPRGTRGKRQENLFEVLISINDDLKEY